jgi:hypothetical protein
MEKLKILNKRIEYASNAIVGAALSIAVFLLIKDGKIVFTYVTEAALLLLFSMAFYAATTWLLMEIAIDIDDKDDD